MTEIEQRLLRVINKRWQTRHEQAKALGISVRQLSRWEYHNDIPRILIRLAEQGVIHIADDSCPCQQPAVTN